MQTERLSDVEVQKFKQFASQIESNEQLEQLLSKSSAKNRRAMYDSLLDYLTFKPKPFWWFSHRAKKSA